MDGAIWIPTPPRSWHTLHADATVVSIDCKPVDPSNPYGALKYARITLKGSAVNVVVEGSKDEGDKFNVRYASYGPRKPWELRVPWGAQRASICILFDNVSEDAEDMELVLFFTSTEPRSKDLKHSEYYGQGLVLKAARTEISGHANLIRGGALHDTVLSFDMWQALRERVVTIE